MLWPSLVAQQRSDFLMMWRVYEADYWHDVQREEMYWLLENQT